ncbi:GTPase ObgE [Candidatus Peregrinibacteria bacterium CG10_big_fil_rev_8_21_14_0_10_49_10]|nr:MAG: GTPase ObgE [Candidatus Peregrinibacteria bacterium CG10_big_fil_rev_8_21_14_0_10_49_10]
MFLDEAIIELSGGNGGDGVVRWRREKFIAKGGPNGGDGGSGGSIYLIANANTDTLSDYSSKKKYRAEDGEPGAKNNRHGKSGDDLFLSVPPGTLVFAVSESGTVSENDLLADLAQNGDQMLLVRGGRGGFGNGHFKSSTRQRPDFAEKGEPGEVRRLKLELKLVADVGIIGYPSAGKSTLISVMSAAKPKIADYEFTTIVPNLGVVDVGDRSYIACDIPGLIEGAHEGKGLGDQFLRHIERCGLLVHLLDSGRCLESGEPDPDTLLKNYQTIRKELEHYSPALASKREVIVLNKTDLIPGQVEPLVSALKVKGLKIFASISAATTEGVKDLKESLLAPVLEEREKQKETAPGAEELQILTPHLDDVHMGAYRIQREADGSLHVNGKRLVQLTVMTNFESEGGIRRFRDVCERIGLLRALEREEMKKGTPVYIGEVRVDDFLHSSHASKHSG